MKLPTGPVETKVAAATIVPLVVAALFGAATFYHWFTPPPAAVTTGLVAILVGAAGWFAPHTSRTPAPPVIRVAGDPSKQPAVIHFEGLQLTDADIERLNSILKGPRVPEPATTMGGVSAT